MVKVDGDPEHPITKGKICGRGRMLADRTNADGRILYPLKKINGNFVKITWEQALDEIAEKMTQIKQQWGTTAVLHSHDYANNGLLKNLDYRFFNCYGGVTELAGSLCWGAGIEAQLQDFGNAYSHAPDDIHHANQIVIWGRNAARTNIHLYGAIVQEKKKGKRVVVIDPIPRETAKLADKVICIRPGTDGLLAFGIMKEMLRLGIEDQHFINQHSIGFEDVETLLESIPLAELSEATGVSTTEMTELARIYGDRPTATFLGLGMQRYENGGNTIRAIDALVAMSGNVGIAGGGANYANRQVGEAFDLDALTLPERKTAERTFSRISQAEDMTSAENPPIKMWFITRSNALTQLPDTHRVREVFSKIETKVVLEQFMTDTAEIADYVLPVATVFEEEDMYYASMYHQYVNYGPKLVEPLGEAKPDSWIWTELAKRLGFGADFDYTLDEFYEMAFQELEHKGITPKQVKMEKRTALPVMPIPWSDFQFQTPSGKYEFTSKRAEQAGLDATLSICYPTESKERNPKLVARYPYQLLSIHPLRSNHSQHYPIIPALQAVRIEVAANIALDHRLTDGDQVRIFNDRGELSGVARVMEAAYPDTINVDEGQWHRFGGSVNQLTSSRRSDNGMGSTFYDCRVQLEKR